MLKEGYPKINSRRFGMMAFLRKKQWWSFEGLDQKSKLYFLVLALKSPYASYVSLKIIDFNTGKHISKDFFGRLSIAESESMTISSKVAGGDVKIRGYPVVVEGKETEKWEILLDSPEVKLNIEQIPRADRPHSNRLLTKRLDYHINQYIMNDCSGTMAVEFENQQVQNIDFTGYGYCEHCWGVQPRQSTAHWLHFWSDSMAGVVMNCFYDEGVPHHYTYLWLPSLEEHYLFSPAQFYFDPL